MLAASAFPCDRTYFFDDVCNAIAGPNGNSFLGAVVERLIGPVIIFAVVYAGGRILRSLIHRAVKRAGGDPQVHALVRNVGAAVTYFFAILAGLVTAGVNPAFLLTFGGLASLAIGLAFQDVLRNILAGIWLLVERPFRIGDAISVADVVGVVQTITLRTTAMRTADGRLAILPNLTVFSGVIVNSSAYGQRRYTVSLRIERDHDLEAAMRGARRELEATKQLAKEPPPTVQPQLDGEGIVLHCNYWLDHRANDVDAVNADVARRLWVITESSSAPPGS
jgi:small conductance mechanosensitive channel